MSLPANQVPDPVDTLWAIRRRARDILRLRFSSQAAGQGAIS